MSDDVPCAHCGEPTEPGSHLEAVSAEVERLAHAMCDALMWLEIDAPESTGTAVLRTRLKGTSHEGHRDDMRATPKR